MKKVIIAILMFLIGPCSVLAIQVKVDNFLVNANVLENGDMEVEELIIAKGSFNWYERDLLYKNSALTDSTFSNNDLYNAKNILVEKVSAKKVKDDGSWDMFLDEFSDFNLDTYGSNGESGKYTLTPISNGNRIRIYYQTNNEEVVFYIKYRVVDLVVLHEDVAELYWTFVPDGFEEDLHNIKIRVSLPNEDSSSNFRYWAHGHLTGEIKKVDNKTVEASIKEVFRGESVDVRLTFDKNLVYNVTKKSETQALDKIILVEKDRAEEANKLRETLRARYNFVYYGTKVFIGGLLILLIYIYFKYGRSPKSNYYSKYNREFIEDYNVEVVDYLMNKKITPNAMSASIMNLIYKKNIDFMKISEKSREYKFTLNNTDNLNESEELLVEFLFDNVGAGKTEDNKKVFTTLELKKYAKGVKTCDKLLTYYQNWQNSVVKKGEEEHFYEYSFKPLLIGIGPFLLGLLFLVYALCNEIFSFSLFVLCILLVVFLFYIIMVNKKTEKGSLHYDKWKAFKNFLNDFGAFDIKELPEIILWEKYLVYATVFGLARNVQESMNVKIKELDIADYDYTPSFIYLNIGDTITANINNALSNAHSRQAANYSNSHSSFSSGSGFGGGFSSGGGFGGGGGGGRFG